MKKHNVSPNFYFKKHQLVPNFAMHAGLILFQISVKGSGVKHAFLPAIDIAVFLRCKMKRQWRGIIFIYNETKYMAKFCFTFDMFDNELQL